MLDIAGELRTNLLATFTGGIQQMETLVLANQLRLNAGRTPDAVKMTSPEWWMIDVDREK